MVGEKGQSQTGFATQVEHHVALQTGSPSRVLTRYPDQAPFPDLSVTDVVGLGRPPDALPHLIRLLPQTTGIVDDLNPPLPFPRGIFRRRHELS